MSRSSNISHSRANTKNRLNGECLILSASKRTLDTCVNEIGNYFPELIKSVILNQSSTRNDIFQDDLLSFVGFQSVFWCDQFHHHSSDVIAPSLMSNYLLLGYVNGVQIWRFRLPSSLESANLLHFPERVVGFRTQYSVVAVQLLSDIPSTGFPLLSKSPNQQPFSRVALVQHRPNVGSSSVDIFSSSAGGSHVHVLQQPWPVVRLASSLSWGGSDDQQHWVGTLVVATTQQIRIYDTSTFELRFTISDFQSISLPPLWRWLSAESLESPFVGLPLRSAPNDPPKTRSSGPIFAIGTRWILYQTTAQDEQRLKPSSGLSDASFSSSSINSRENDCRSWIGPVAMRWRKLMSSPTITRLSSRRRLGDLLFDQADSIGSFLPVVEKGKPHGGWTMADEGGAHQQDQQQQQFAVNTEPVGGPIVIVDVISGEVVGSVDVDAFNNVDPKILNNSNHGGLGTSSSSSSNSPLSGFCCCPGCDILSISEVQDGSWWLSHLETSRSTDGNSPMMMAESCLKRRRLSVPLISYMSMDLSGTTLFCADWTGRSVWVIRLSTPTTVCSSQQRSRIVGVPVYELFRGHTAGSLVDVTSSSNVVGETVVVVASSRGSAHCFSLPSSFHQSQVQTAKTDGSISLLFPLPLSSDFLPNRDQSKRRFRSSCDDVADHKFSDNEEDYDDHECNSSEEFVGISTFLSDMHNNCSRSVMPIAPLPSNVANGRVCQSANRRRSICRMNLLSANKLEDTNFYWKVNFLPSPFFLPSAISTAASQFRRSFRLFWRQSDKVDEQSHLPFQPALPCCSISLLQSRRFFLPFLIASSNGVIDFCHAEFAVHGNRNDGISDWDNQYCKGFIEPTVPFEQQFPPRVIRSSLSGVCLVAEDEDGENCGLMPTAIDDRPAQRDFVIDQDVSFAPTWLPSNTTTRLSFVTTSIALSYSSRDIEICRNPIKPSPPSTTPSSRDCLTRSKAKVVWAQYSEPITSIHHKCSYIVRFVCGRNWQGGSCRSEADSARFQLTPNTGDSLNRLFRSGSCLRHLFVVSDIQLNLVSSRLQMAIKEALNCVIKTNSKKNKLDTSSSSSSSSYHLASLTTSSVPSIASYQQFNISPFPSRYQNRAFYHDVNNNKVIAENYVLYQQ